MDAIEAILRRRSIRKYTNAPVPEPAVQTLLKAAMHAPSAFDERPWHFVLIRKQKTLRDLGANMPHCEMLLEAQLGLLICGDESLEKLKGFWIQDCSACTENVLLAAHAQGLGAVWIGIYPVDERVEAVRKILRVPPEVTPFALIALGCPAETLFDEDRFDSSRVHNDRW